MSHKKKQKTTIHAASFLKIQAMALSFLKAPTAQVMLPTVVGDSPYPCCRNTPTFYLLEFMQSDGSFVAVDSSVHPYILPWLQKKGRRSGAVSAHVASTGQCYVFDFDTMVQINLATDTNDRFDSKKHEVPLSKYTRPTHKQT